MSRRLIVRPEAALWYDEREAGLGLELTLEVRTAIRRALETPLLHLLLRERPEVRRILPAFSLSHLPHRTSRCHRRFCHPPCGPARPPLAGTVMIAGELVNW